MSTDVSAEAPAVEAQVLPAAEGHPAGNPGASLYRTVWRWHFFAGILVAPILFTVAITGGIYVFKDELEREMYPNLMFVTPQSARVPLEKQVAAAESAYPGSKADTVEVETDPTRATSVRIVGGPARNQRVYVNPHTGEVQGSITEESFFRVVLDIHRRLFVGSTGRVVVELVTGWTILLLLTGVYLWFPRRASLRGVLIPRLRARPYTVLRDLHALAGMAILPIALSITATGLVYTIVWGNGYVYASSPSQPTPTPKSTSSAKAPTLSLDRTVEIARAQLPDSTFVDVRLPAKPEQAFVARAKLSESGGPRHQVVLALDRSTGEILDRQSSEQYPALRWWRTTWNYPLHVGSVLGTPTKVLWLLTCLVLAALPATGLLMWWKRRPTGRTGFPRATNRSLPIWLVALVGVACLALPLVGASVLLILAGEAVYGRMRRREALPASI